MSDTPSLADQIAGLAKCLTADADLIPFQRRVLASLDQIETILARGVPLRRLAAALAKAGLRDGSGQPLTESHFRAAVSRARSRRRQTGPEMATTPRPAPPPEPSPLARRGDTRADTSSATDFFARQEAAQQRAATADADRPDFTGGLFGSPGRPAGKPPPKR